MLSRKNGGRLRPSSVFQFNRFQALPDCEPKARAYECEQARGTESVKHNKNNRKCTPRAQCKRNYTAYGGCQPKTKRAP